jgi:hypothetical protein
MTNPLPIPPEAVGALVGVLLVVTVAARGVPRSVALRAERGRSAVWRALTPLTRALWKPLAWRKRPDEYICTVDTSLRVLTARLYAGGWRWNPVSSKKYRVLADGGRQYTVMTLAWRESLRARWQYHIYVFPAADGEGYDVYCHREWNYLASPRRHFTGSQTTPDESAVLNDLGSLPTETRDRPAGVA